MVAGAGNGTLSLWRCRQARHTLQIERQPLALASGIMNRAHAVVLGAAGAMAEVLVRELLAEPTVTKVTWLVNQEVNRVHPKLLQMVVDFARPQDVVPTLHPAPSTVYCCIQPASPRQMGYRSNRDVIQRTVLAFGEHFHALGVPSFIWLSSISAHAGAALSRPGSLSRTERALDRLGFSYLGIARPAYIVYNTDPSRQTRPRRSLRRQLAPFLRDTLRGPFARLRPIRARDAARALVFRGLHPGEGTEVIPNELLEAWGRPAINLHGRRRLG